MPINVEPVLGNKAGEQEQLVIRSSDNDNGVSVNVEPFWGNKAEENAQDFIRAFHRAMGDKDDDHKRKQFLYYLKADSEADEWYAELGEETKAKWELIETAFDERWPRARVVKKTVAEYEEELLGLRLSVGKLGEKETVAGRESYTHIIWAEKMGRLAKGAGVEKESTYIGKVIKTLPRVMKERVAGTYGTWDEFLKAVREVDMDYIKDGVKEYLRDQKERDELRARVKQLEARCSTGGIENEFLGSNIDECMR